MVITETIHEHLLKVPASAWTPVVETDGEARDEAWVAEITGKLLDGRLKGIRMTCFATNTPDRPIAELELRHRLWARAEHRIDGRSASSHLQHQPLSFRCTRDAGQHGAGRTFGGREPAVTVIDTAMGHPYPAGAAEPLAAGER